MTIVNSLNMVSLITLSVSMDTKDSILLRLTCIEYTSFRHCGFREFLFMILLIISLWQIAWPVWIPGA